MRRQPKRGCSLTSPSIRAASRPSSSAAFLGGCRCVERCCPSTRQARRSETPKRSGRKQTACRRWSAAATFLGGLLEHLLVQGQLGGEALEAGVLRLQLLKPLGLVGLEAAVLVAPAVQGLLAGAEALADLGDAQALGQVGLGLAQLGDDFFSRVPLHGSFPGPAGPQRLSYHLNQFLGSRSPWPASCRRASAPRAVSPLATHHGGGS